MLTLKDKKQHQSLLCFSAFLLVLFGAIAAPLAWAEQLNSDTSKSAPVLVKPAEMIVHEVKGQVMLVIRDKDGKVVGLVPVVAGQSVPAGSVFQVPTGSTLLLRDETGTFVPFMPVTLDKVGAFGDKLDPKSFVTPLAVPSLEGTTGEGVSASPV